MMMTRTTTRTRIGGVVGTVFIAFLLCSSAEAWTGEIRGKVVCDVCGDSSIGPEDHVLKEIMVSRLGTLPTLILDDQSTFLKGRLV